MARAKRVTREDQPHNSIPEIEVAYGKVRAHHSEDLVRLKFTEGSYGFIQQESKMNKSNGVKSGVVVILEPEECLDLINMLQSHYDYVAKKYEFGYGLDNE